MYRLHGQVATRALRTLWTLEEVGAPYAFVPADPRSEAAFALNPLGKIPVLETPEGVILDSVAQMQHLADRHAAGMGDAAPTYPAAATCARVKTPSSWPCWS